MKKTTLAYLFLSLLIISCKEKTHDCETTLDIDVDFSEKIGAMEPVWAWFGYDEPNYTYMKDGQKLLSELADLSPVPVNVRTHSMLVTGDGIPKLKWGSTNAYTEDTDGNPIYDWTIVDKIFDTYIERGMKPLVEIGFMPKAMSTQPSPYIHNWEAGDHYTKIFSGWTYPPKDYEKWAELIYQWAKHSAEKYGQEEAESWYWELWNEPNIGYWSGTTEEYIKLYDYTVDAVKRALPNARVGGPHTTGPNWDESEKFLRAFLDHVVDGTNYATGKKGSPIDYIGFHAKGRPTLKDSIVLMDMGAQLRDVSKGFEIVASYPTLKHLPIIIGESDPEGCAACSMQYSPENAYRNGTMYSSYTAASFSRVYELAEHWGINLGGIVTWAFEFENQPYYNGYRDLATNGIDKPVLNIFRMFGKMQGDRVRVSGDLNYNFETVRDSSVRSQRDINAMATIDKNKATVLVWNYHDLHVLTADTLVYLNVTGIPTEKATLTHYRVDQTHSNSYTTWKKMGSPQDLTQSQYTDLEASGQLDQLGTPERIRINGGEYSIPLQMEGQSVSLLVFEW